MDMFISRKEPFIDWFIVFSIFEETGNIFMLHTPRFNTINNSNCHGESELVRVMESKNSLQGTKNIVRVMESPIYLRKVGEINEMLRDWSHFIYWNTLCLWFEVKMKNISSVKKSYITFTFFCSKNIDSVK